MSLRLIGGLALLPALHGLRLGSERRAFEPDFFACEGEKGEPDAFSCSGSATVPSRQMDDLLEAGYRRMRATVEAGREALAVQVGADGLNNPARWTDVHLWSHVGEGSGLRPGQLRTVFAEPIASKTDDFNRHVGMIPILSGKAYLATAMVDGHCEAAKETLYMVSPQASRDFNFSQRAAQGWVSTDPQHPANVVHYLARTGAWMGCYGDNSTWDCTKNFQRFSKASNFTDYIQKVDIRCQTLEGLVKESGARLDDMGMVVVDAEGKDAVILLALVDREDFKPGFIMWEDSHHSRDASQDLVRALRQRGYKVGAKSDMVTTNGRVSDSGNFVAVLE